MGSGLRLWLLGACCLGASAAPLFGGWIGGDPQLRYGPGALTAPFQKSADILFLSTATYADYIGSPPWTVWNKNSMIFGNCAGAVNASASGGAADACGAWRAALATRTAKAAAFGQTKVFVSIGGGAAAFDDDWFANIDSLIALCTATGLDGIDVDFESYYSSASKTPAQAVAEVVKAIKAIKAAGLGVTYTISGAYKDPTMGSYDGTYPQFDILTQAVESIDKVIIMLYSNAMYSDFACYADCWAKAGVEPDVNATSCGICVDGGKPTPVHVVPSMVPKAKLAFALDTANPTPTSDVSDEQLEHILALTKAYGLGGVFVWTLNPTDAAASARNQKVRDACCNTAGFQCAS